MSWVVPANNLADVKIFVKSNRKIPKPKLCSLDAKTTTADLTARGRRRREQGRNLFSLPTH
jgi:hypothetical protein